MKKIFAFLAVLMISAALYAQMDITKIGVIDRARVYATYFRKTQQVRNYDDMKLEFQTEVEKTNAEIKSMTLRLTALQKAGNELEAMALQTEIAQKNDWLLQYTIAKNADLAAMKEKLEENDSFYNSLNETIEKIAEAKGYTIILDAQNTKSIIWFSQLVDITDQVIEALASVQ